MYKTITQKKTILNTVSFFNVFLATISFSQATLLLKQNTGFDYYKANL